MFILIVSGVDERRKIEYKLFSVGNNDFVSR